MYCKHCGQQLSDDAVFCQKCGKPVSEGVAVNVNPVDAKESAPANKKKKRKSIFKRWWFWVLAIIVLFVSCVGTSEPAPVQPDISESEYKGMCTEIAFSDLARNPDSYVGQFFKFTGSVIQVVEGSSSVAIRMNVTPVSLPYSEDVYYEDTIYVTLRLEGGSDRILEEDVITVYGICTGMYEYTSILGQQISLPGIDAMYYELIND